MSPDRLSNESSESSGKSPKDWRGELPAKQPARAFPVSSSLISQDSSKEFSEAEVFADTTSQSVPEIAEATGLVATTVCWRCEKEYPASQIKCGWCSAQNRNRTGVSVEDQKPISANGDRRDSRQMKIVFWSFALLLLSGVSHGVIGRMLGAEIANDAEKLESLQFSNLVSIELVDTVIVVFAIFLCGRVTVSYSTAARPLRTWLLAAPLLAGLLAIDFGYHIFLQDWIGMEAEETFLSNEKWFAWLLLTFCLQPAMIEELFMRYLMLDVLRQHVSAGAAIWITSLAFALLHLGAPLSMPYLFLAGLLFGYLRVASGGLLLPMLAHFLHNLIVLGYHQL